MTIEMTKELMIERIKKRMAKDKNISINVIYDFKRKLDRNPLTKLLVDMLIESENQRLHKQSKITELQEEIKYLNTCLRATLPRRQIMKDEMEQYKSQLNDRDYISNICNYYKKT
jgi:hypothetical protein